MSQWWDASFVASVVLASCTLLTGADELTTTDAVEGGSATPNDGTITPGEDGGSTPADGGTDIPPPDASVDANGTCASPNLVARWKLDEGSGTVVNDCTSNAINGAFFVDGGGVGDAVHRRQDTQQRDTWLASRHADTNAAPHRDGRPRG